ncbi:TetR/AcrR family transcriptional regulator [Janthinobacterium sp. Mn2066]|uniref:TetR/AcrR family transcriptional regulator n=1 Tax=Janthinobacterium sp. Mn2066 TaxID=3395264 RepID=UPI003BDEF3EF
MSEVKRGRGRPRKLECQETLLEVGKNLLLTHGLRVSVDAIVAKAEVAKTTFYTYFADKEAFIEAVLLRESAHTISDDDFSSAATTDLREVLLAFGTRYLRFANQRHLLGWDRLIASAYDIYPELARRLYEAGPGRGYTLLTFILRQAASKGQLRLDDPAAAAEDLTALWYGTTILRINLRVSVPLTDDAILARARRGVDLFFKLYG